MKPKLATRINILNYSTRMKFTFPLIKTEELDNIIQTALAPKPHALSHDFTFLLFQCDKILLSLHKIYIFETTELEKATKIKMFYKKQQWNF